jgi:TPP-dependent indolepyruvate ferredoxin oxidoreductase alpha subunit
LPHFPGVVLKKAILSGNEAIARGFIEAGGKLAAGYPGTPSTEVIETLSCENGIHAEWSVNEKVALEAPRRPLSGVRSLVHEARGRERGRGPAHDRFLHRHQRRARAHGRR